MMRISFRFTVGKVASGTSGQLLMTRLSVSPRIAWDFRLLVVAQTVHTARNARSTDFIVFSKMEAITVREFGGLERSESIAIWYS